VNYAIVIELFVGASIFVVGIPALAIEWRRRKAKAGLLTRVKGTDLPAS